MAALALAGLLVFAACGDRDEVGVGEGGVWVSNSADDTVSRIDPSSNEVVAGIDVCAAPEGLAVADGSVWVVCETTASSLASIPVPRSWSTRSRLGSSRGS